MASIVYQVQEIWNKSGINQIGTSKHAAKEEARHELESSGQLADWHAVGKEMGIHSFATADAYRNVWVLAGKFAKAEFRVKYMENLTGEHIRAFLESKVAEGVAHGNTQHAGSAMFGGSTAIYFDGVGDYLKLANSSDWNFGTGDFTIDLWMDFSSAPVLYEGVISGYKSGPAGYTVEIYNGTIQWYSLATDWMNTGVTPAVGQWYHLAIVRFGNTVKVYVNGVMKVSKATTGSINSDGDGLVLGRAITNMDAFYFTGYLDEISVSKGFARWTGNFTPPNHPGPNGDYDLDGITDSDETNIYGTNYLLADTDGDGLNDGVELIYWGTSWNTDYDQDGLNNLRDADSDNDGVNDYIEINESHTSPSDAASRPDTLLSKTKLYLYSNTTNGSTVFVDSSPIARAITAYGNTQHAGSAMFGGSTAVYCDGVGDYLKLANSSDWNFGTGDFTIDLWMNFASTPVLYEGVISGYKSGPAGYTVQIYNGTIQWYSPATDWMNTGVTPAVGQWYHLAIVRFGNTVKVYVNGVMKVSKATTGSINSDGDGLVLGRAITNMDAFYFTGYLDEIAVSKGFARWIANFTPPNNPDINGDYDMDGVKDADETGIYHTDPTKADTDNDGLSDYDEIFVYHTDPLKADTDGDGVSDNDEITAGTNPSDVASRPDTLLSKTKLYIYSNTTDGSTAFTDSSPAGRTVTAYGNTQHAGSAMFGGSTAIYFDGVGDYLKLANSSDWNFGTGDFTIDLWMDFSSAPVLYEGVISGYKSGPAGYTVEIYNGTIQWYSPATDWMNTGVTPAVGQWYHLAIVRFGNTVKVYVNGVMKVSKATTGSINSDGDGLVLGRAITNMDAFYFTGYLDEIAVSKGFARWTGNFTPLNRPAP